MFSTAPAATAATRRPAREHHADRRDLRPAREDEHRQRDRHPPGQPAGHRGRAERQPDDPVRQADERDVAEQPGILGSRRRPLRRRGELFAIESACSI